MPDMRRKLDRFTASIMEDAAAESERTLKEVRQRWDSIMSEAEDKALQESYQYINQEVVRIKGAAGRRVSRHMLDNKRALYLRREEIAQEVFSQVRKKIEDFTHTPAYAERLQALLLEALERLQGADDVQVTLRPEDQALLPALERAAEGRSVQFAADGTFQMGGLIAQSVSQGLRVDSSFDSAAGDLSGHFAELFGLALPDNE